MPGPHGFAVRSNPASPTAFVRTDFGASRKALPDKAPFVSAVDVHPDGKKTDRWGANAKGIFMFDPPGHFAQFITRSDLPKFAAGTADKGTAEETKAVLSGFVASFGTYTVNESDKTVTTHVEGSVFPNLIGRDQKRLISTLTAEELKYTNPTTSTGTTAEATWRRVK